MIHKNVREAEEEVREAGNVYPLPPSLPLLDISHLVIYKMILQQNSLCLNADLLFSKKALWGIVLNGST